ncbi:MAG: preprotein translocase subunit SecG [Lentilitoribacter sp.]
METVLIVVHLMIVVALVGVVLLQRSEGGGLGIGGGSGGGGGLMTARGAASALTRVTGILAAAFFATSLALGIIAANNNPSSGILNQIESSTQGDGNGILNQLGGSDTTTTTEPENTEPSVPTGN